MAVVLNSINTSHLQKEESEKASDCSKRYFVDTTNRRSFEPDFPREEPDKRKYSIKVVKSGDFVQVYQYHRPQAKTVPGKGKKSTQHKKGVRMDNIYRARTALKRLINTNRDRGPHSDKFVTLTFADSSWSDLKAANYEVHKFMMRLEYQLKIRVRYAAVPEIQMDRWKSYGTKVWHFHVYFFGLPFIANKKLREIWGHGFVRINRVDKQSDVGSYVAKYMQESFSAFNEKGMKRFFRSSGLLEPEELRAESVAQILARMDLPEECKVYGPQTFINQQTGALTYSLYDLRKKEDVRNGKAIPDNNETLGNDRSSGRTVERGISESCESVSAKKWAYGTE